MCCFPSLWCYLVLLTAVERHKQSDFHSVCHESVCLSCLAQNVFSVTLISSSAEPSETQVTSVVTVSSAAHSRARTQNPLVPVLLPALKAGGFVAFGCFGVGFFGFVFFILFLGFNPVMGLGLSNRNWEHKFRNLHMLLSNVWAGTRGVF